MNKWIGIGRLTKAPELRRTQSGKAVTTFTLAIDDGWGDNKSTDFIDVVAWEKTAENCCKYLSKGSKVAVVGKIKKRSYDKNGQKVWVTEIRAEEVEFVESKNAQTPAQSQPKPQYSYAGTKFEDVDDDEDLPF